MKLKSILVPEKSIKSEKDEAVWLCMISEVTGSLTRYPECLKLVYTCVKVSIMQNLCSSIMMCLIEG